jgi:hypothetical protein
MSKLLLFLLLIRKLRSNVFRTSLVVSEVQSAAMNDPLSSAFEQLVDGKVELMEELTTALAAASYTSAICTYFAHRLRRFIAFAKRLKFPSSASLRIA